jgi:hypothetical protein
MKKRGKKYDFSSYAHETQISLSINIFVCLSALGEDIKEEKKGGIVFEFANRV